MIDLLVRLVVAVALTPLVWLGYGLLWLLDGTRYLLFGRTRRG